MKDIFIKKGRKKGPISVIFAGIHGNEICGVESFKKIIPKLEIEKGQVYFVLGNPEAIKKNVRFTEYNLNRLFSVRTRYSVKIKKTYEYKRALFLKGILDKASALLDIHSTKNKSNPFIISEKNSENITKKLPSNFKRIVFGINNIEPGGTDGYMLAQNKIGICVECGQHTNKQAITVASKAIMVFLTVRGHIPEKKKLLTIKHPKIHMDSMYITKTNEFKLAKNFLDFEKIKKNQIIGIDGKKIIKAKKNGFIVFAHDSNIKGSEGFMFGHQI